MGITSEEIAITSEEIRINGEGILTEKPPKKPVFDPQKTPLFLPIFNLKIKKGIYALNFGRNSNKFRKNGNNFGRNKNYWGRNAAKFGKNNLYWGRNRYKWGNNSVNE